MELLFFAFLIVCIVGFYAVTALLADLNNRLDKFIALEQSNSRRIDAVIEIVRLQQQLLTSESDQLARIMKAIQAVRN